MKRYSEKEINYVRDLRRAGKSIPQIADICGSPKTTIWHHVHDIVLDDKKLSEIRSRQGGSVARKIEAWNAAKKEADLLLLDKENRELIIAVAMLYWAEGNKRSFVFTNTDADMLRMYIRFLIKVLKIAKNDIKILIRISDPINPQVATKYWKNELKIKVENINIDHNNKNNKTKTLHGICRLYVVKSGYQFKLIQCIIENLKNL